MGGISLCGSVGTCSSYVLSLCDRVMRGSWTCLTNKDWEKTVTHRVTLSLVKKRALLLHISQVGKQEKGAGSQGPENSFSGGPFG